jgi:hypothetical protein
VQVAALNTTVYDPATNQQIEVRYRDTTLHVDPEYCYAVYAAILVCQAASDADCARYEANFRNWFGSLGQTRWSRRVVGPESTERPFSMILLT